MDKDTIYEDPAKDEDSDDYEDNPLERVLSPEEIFWQATRNDDCTTFVAMINNGFTRSELIHPQDILDVACQNSAVRCVSALLKGETCLTVDINSPCDKMKSALHSASDHGHPGLTELLLVNNARTGVRRVDYQCFTLPLHLALESGKIRVLNGWTPKHSINQLLFFLCLPHMQRALETVGLLAWTTKQTEREFLRYVEIGRVFEVAALLMVAWKKLRGPAKTARSMLTQNEVLVSGDVKTAMLQLFEIFESAGDDLEAYVKLPKLFVCQRRAIYAVKYLLQGNGIHVEPEETDLDFLPRAYHDYSTVDVDFSEFVGPDFGMEHYGRSGYRWIYPPLLWKIDQILHAPLFLPNTKNTNFPTINRATALNSESATDRCVEALNEVKGWRFNLWNVVSSKSRLSFALVRKLLK